ncbi:glutamate receptor kainate 2-like isoform X1, partial [Brachionus plicatilis]
TSNALLFDSIFTLASAIREAEQAISLVEGNVSCISSKSLSYGRKFGTFVERVAVHGLTGLIKFQNKQRREFDLDVLQLKEIGLYKCGTWSSQKGLNFTFYDEVYEDNTINSRKNNFRVVTLVPRVEQTLVLKVTTKLILNLLDKAFSAAFVDDICLEFLWFFFLMSKNFRLICDLKEEPYVIEKDGKLQGFCIDILDEIANKMNFRYEIYKVADNQYGNEENGSWNGMIKELVEKKADLAISAFTINYKRQQVVDFTKPFLSLGISILYKIPTSKKPGLFSFLNPLSLEIWMFTLITYVLVSLIMMVLARFSPYEWRSTHPCDSNNEYVENQFTVWNSLWFAVGTLMQQGSDINPKALSTRLVGGVWWFFTLIIISSYTANLAAFLTVEKVDLTITNVEDLANQTKVLYGAFKGGSTMNFFKDSKIETYQRMWRQMRDNPDKTFVTSNQEGIERVLREDYAYLMESPLIDYEIQRNCNLTQIGGLLDSKGYGIATQLGSPYTDDISLKILEMQEKGEIQKFYNRWWKGGSTCIRDEKKDSKANPLKVENVGGIFVVLVGGCLLAVVVSFFEFIYYAKTNSKLIKKPVCSQMIDDLRFAIKCGGSAKKIQLSSTTAVSVKPLPPPSKTDSTGSLHKKLSKSTGNLELKECKKCQEILHNELLDNITSHNSIVCKNDSRSNLSIRNPGLLIVEREAALDAQAAFLNSQLNPHLHKSHQKSELKQKKHKSRKTKALLRVDSNDESSDYIKMNTFNRNVNIDSNRSNSSRLKQSISKSRDQYDIPIIRMNKNIAGVGNRHHSSTQHRDTSSNSYQTSNNF